MITKMPKVIMFNHTPNPEKSIGLAVSAWHATSEEFPESFDSFQDDQAKVLARAGMKAFHKVAIEYVNIIFIIKNVSRAFQQQLTRTRHASFSIQSMRMVTKTNFASDGQYTMPPYLDDAQKSEYHEAMLEIESKYNKLISSGVPIEDARGILPLNIHSDITMSINLNALYHMLGQRLCVNTQWEFRQVATQMKELVYKNIGPIFSAPIDAPCVKAKTCPMGSDYCLTPVWTLNEEKRIEFYLNYTKKKEA